MLIPNEKAVRHFIHDLQQIEVLVRNYSLVNLEVDDNTVSFLLPSASQDKLKIFLKDVLEQIAVDKIEMNVYPKNNTADFEIEIDMER